MRGFKRAVTAGFGLCLLAGAAPAITSSWIGDAGSSNWSDSANWDNGVPLNAGDVANLTNAITAARIITVDTNVTVGAIKIGASGVTNAVTLNLGGSGMLTFNGGGGGNALLQLNAGGTRPQINANFTVGSDLDIVSRQTSGIYFGIGSAISGTNNFNVNTGVATGGTPYMGGNNAQFFGNVNLWYGQLMLSGGDAIFGSTTNGTRLITFYNNASFRNNGTLSNLSSNRQFVAGNGGGNFILHARNVYLNYPSQLAGSNTFTLSTDSGVTTNNTFAINATNDGFTGTMLLSANVALKLGTGGALGHCPLINLSDATCLLDVTNKLSGYSVPANQILAGIGLVTGGVSVATATAILHPGTYSLPGPVKAPGVLTLYNGLTLSGGGVYAWELNQLKDDGTTFPSATTFSSINVTSGVVNLSGGALALDFLGTVITNHPNSTNSFWKSNGAHHVWTILTATNPPSGTLTVSNGTYSNGYFQTQVSGNNLQLVYTQGKIPNNGGSTIILR